MSREGVDEDVRDEQREAELRRGIARVESLLRAGCSEDEIVLKLRDQFAA